MGLIDSDAIKKRALRNPDIVVDGQEYISADSIDDFAIDNSIDAVPVVRCKDCKYYVRGSCDLHSVWPDEYTTGYDHRPDDDDFCSYGEQRIGIERG